MIGLCLTPAAQGDLEDIWNDAEARWGADQARQSLELIWGTLLILRDDQRLCRDVPARSGYVKTFAGSHVIFCKLSAASLDVVRVLHDSMELIHPLHRVRFLVVTRLGRPDFVVTRSALPSMQGVSFKCLSLRSLFADPVKSRDRLSVKGA